MDYVVAVPSYRRADVFERKSYTMLTPELRRHTSIFVQTPEDLQEYTARFPDVQVVPTIDADGGWTSGFGNTMHFIRQRYPLGKRICFLHDDVQELVRSTPDADVKRSTKPACLETFLEQVFQRMEATGARLAGVYPCEHWCTHKREAETLGLKFIYDPLHFEINMQLPKCKYESKADFETTAEAFVRYGNVLRFNHYAVKTRHCPLTKASSWARTSKLLRDDAEGLLQDYPELFKGTRFFPGSGDYTMVFRKV